MTAWRDGHAGKCLGPDLKQLGQAPGAACRTDLCTRLGRGCQQHGAVGVAYLPRAQFLCCRVHHLIPCGHDCHMHLPVYLQRG